MTLFHKQIFVYRNLHKKCFSLRDPSTGRVGGNHKNEVFLVAANFKVSERGRLQVVATKRKNVHAGVCGLEVSKDFFEVQKNHYNLKPVEVSYNPYLGGNFFYKQTNQKVDTANFVHCVDNRVFVFE